MSLFLDSKDLNVLSGNSLDSQSESPKLKRYVHHGYKRRRSYHHLRFKRALINLPEYFYEFTWTNRSLVTSYMHSANAFGGGTMIETETCPRDVIQRDIFGRLFPTSANEFRQLLDLQNNGGHNLDIMELYGRLFEGVEANVEFLSVEWSPKSVCSISSGFEHRTLGAKPIRASDVEDEDDSNLDSASAQPTQSATASSDLPAGSVPSDDAVDTSTTTTYLGDKLLTMIIPPIAILTALLFAVGIGCCFHRANARRKAMGTMQEITEENPNLYRQRIPIQFEFERGGGPGMRATEHEAMIDTRGRHPVMRSLMPH